jgi:hypothetical protein
VGISAVLISRQALTLERLSSVLSKNINNAKCHSFMQESSPLAKPVLLCHFYHQRPLENRRPVMNGTQRSILVIVVACYKISSLFWVGNRKNQKPSLTTTSNPEILAQCLNFSQSRSHLLVSFSICSCVVLHHSRDATPNERQRRQMCIEIGIIIFIRLAIYIPKSIQRLAMRRMLCMLSGGIRYNAAKCLKCQLNSTQYPFPQITSHSKPSTPQVLLLMLWLN